MASPASPAPLALASMQRRAMGSVLIAIAILTLMDAGIKLMAGTFGTPQILVMRYSAGLLVAAVLFLGLLVSGRVDLPTWRSLVRSFQRSMLVTLVAACFFYALSVIPLAEATAIAFTAPLYLALLGWLILKEPVDGKTWIAILIGLAGVGVISSSAFANGFSGALSGYIAAAVASFAYAAALVLTRLHAASDPVPTMIMLQSGFSALLALPLLALTIAGFAMDGRPFVPLTSDWLWLALGIGFLGTIGHLFMTYGFKHAPAAKLGPMEYTSLLWAAFYGFVFFAEVPGIRLVLGSALIVIGTWIVMRKEKDTGTVVDAV
ncbi:DMT family transporter [Ahrensia marina]|uniref:DMT family transporter n=1 Tax=Ahrensia marina TaxID=1514904 RepID=UPI0035CF748A